MIKITVYKDSREVIQVLSLRDMPDTQRKDMILSVPLFSVLTVNTINSIESFTSDTFHVKQKDGFIECRFDHPPLFGSCIADEFHDSWFTGNRKRLWS